MESSPEWLHAIYPELRVMAARLLRQERSGHTLQRTALVHEAFLRLFPKRQFLETSSREFLGLAAHQMRQVLIDYGRKRKALKRGGDAVQIPLFPSHSVFERDEDELLALNEALEKLGRMDGRALSVVELKFFGGFTNAETAAILHLSDATVEATWQHARLWLFRELKQRPHTNGAAAAARPFNESFQRA